MSGYDSLTPQEQVGLLEAAAHGALREWDIEGATLGLLKHRENAVFSVEKDGFRAALRLHRHGYHTDAELRSELQWMQALSDAGIRVPEIIPAVSGEPFVNCDAEGLPGTIQVDLFRWIDGRQLGSVEAGIDDVDAVDRTFGALGELAARVHNQAVSWTLPNGYTRHAWDAEGLAGERPFWGRFWEIENAGKEQRDLLRRARKRLRSELGALPKSPGGYSMIHADFAAENVMLEGGDVRLIDFDDAGFGWHLFELVTALIFISGEDYFDRARDALIAGYRKHRQLTEDDLARLPLFFLARATTYVGWVHTRPETDTAKELTPMIVEMACEFAEDYLSN
ncbi:MAG: phosphotransferase [Gammaproteobacteria bacterium]|nr:phosphotransferase [Gammaproteobacteria bacterium]